MSLLEQQKGLTDLIPSNSGCGCDYERYQFTQSDTEVVITVPVPQGTTGKQVCVVIEPTTISIGIRGDQSILSGALYRPVKAEDSVWSIEDRRLLVVTLSKTNLKFEEWWPHVVTTERQMDIRTLVPPEKHIRDLDSGAQATVHKMMFDQDQKRKGLPSSDEMLMQKMMRE